MVEMFKNYIKSKPVTDNVYSRFAFWGIGGLGEIISPKKNKKMKNVIMLSQHSKGVFLFSDKAVSGCLLNGSSGRAEFIFSVSVNIFDKFSLMLS